MRIGIIRLSSMGDIIISSSFLGALKALCKNSSIEWFVDSKFAGILHNSPCISKIHSLDIDNNVISSVIGVREYCRACGHFDLVVDMQGLLKSALVGKFLSKTTYVGFSFKGAREAAASFLYNKKVKIDYDKNILERNFKVLFEFFNFNDMNKALSLRHVSLNFNVRNIDFSLIEMLKGLSDHRFSDFKDYGRGTTLESFQSDLELSKDNQTLEEKNNLKEHSDNKILFVIESSSKEKMYPIRQFVELAKMLSKFLKKYRFFILWNEHEKLANDLSRILSDNNIKFTRLPKLNFNALKFSISQMDCVIGGDTGVTHLAWLFRVKSITLYGNSLESSSKSTSKTSLSRVLLGGSYISSQSNKFEIGSISPKDIFELYKKEIYKIK